MIYESVDELYVFEPLVGRALITRTAGCWQDREIRKTTPDDKLHIQYSYYAATRYHLSYLIMNIIG